MQSWRTSLYWIKMNSLTDKKIMREVIKASQAGVKIDMVIRGICCLIPGSKGVKQIIFK